MYNQRTWVLTDTGAVNFFTLQRMVIQQQEALKAHVDAILALRAEVATLKQLSAPQTQNRSTA